MSFRHQFLRLFVKLQRFHVLSLLHQLVSFLRKLHRAFEEHFFILRIFEARGGAHRFLPRVLRPGKQPGFLLHRDGWHPSPVKVVLKVGIAHKAFCFFRFGSQKCFFVVFESLGLSLSSTCVFGVQIILSRERHSPTMGEDVVDTQK